MTAACATRPARPFYVDAGSTWCRSAALLSQQGLTDALVRDGERLGIFTTTDLRDALLRPTRRRLAVREIASFDLIEIAPDADLFEALWLMPRHRVHRLLVREARRCVRACSASSTWWASSPTIRTSSRCRSTRLPSDRRAGGAAAQRIDAMVALLHDGGISIERIARLVSELNARLIRAAVVAARAARTGRQQLPGRDGQRRPRRADRQDRPGQRAAAARRFALSDLEASRRALQRPRWPTSAIRPAPAASC